MAGRAKTLDPTIFTIDDLKRLGTARLSRTYQEYYNEGAMDLISLKANEAAYQRYMFRPRVLVNVKDCDTSAEIFGSKVKFPLGFSPTAMHKIAHPDGELATSRAAAKANICMAISSYSTTSMEDIINAGGNNPYCFQVTMLNNRDYTLDMIRRAEKAGCKAILVSVDIPILGRRLNEMRNDFALPTDMAIPNMPVGSEEIIRGTNDGINYDPSIEWGEVIPWLRKQTSMELWLKGVTTPEDVEKAIEHGIDGVLISNHGGRQLDGIPATLDILEQCGELAKGKIKLAVDGGIKRGSDIFKAIALGASHCFVGRVPIWGLAHNGQAGVELAIEMLYQEFRTVMLLTGCKTVKDISRKHLAVMGSNGRLHKL